MISVSNFNENELFDSKEKHLEYLNVLFENNYIN